VPGAVRRVFDSASAARVAAYREARAETSGETSRPRMAVLVQVMIEADAAGVAFTANPFSGDRDEVFVTAVRGFGERLVSGEAVGDEWVIRGGEATCRREREEAISAGQAVEIAELARRVEERFGPPQDVEWAISGNKLYLLQARPMTALPAPVEWEPPEPGYWMRNFRLGEWLPEAMTPLFADWLLELIEDGYLRGMRNTFGAAVPFRYAAIHGWYYTTLPRVSPRLLARALIRSRGRLIPFVWNALVRVNSDPVAADRALLRRLAEEWRTDVLPRYRRLVDTAWNRVESATSAPLAGIVDEVGAMAGEHLFSLAVVGGSAWKMEGRLAAFCRQHLAGKVDFSYQVLLRGLPGMDAGVPPHAAQSADWYHPTLGEIGVGDAVGDDPAHRLGAERQAAEEACRTALADRPELLSRFDALLEVAQRYAVIRERQARDFTPGLAPATPLRPTVGRHTRHHGSLGRRRGCVLPHPRRTRGTKRPPRDRRRPQAQVGLATPTGGPARLGRSTESHPQAHARFGRDRAHQARAAGRDPCRRAGQSRARYRTGPARERPRGLRPVRVRGGARRPADRARLDPAVRPGRGRSHRRRHPRRARFPRRPRVRHPRGGRNRGRDAEAAQRPSRHRRRRCRNRRIATTQLLTSHPHVRPWIPDPYEPDSKLA
jgi:hypothetical protein